MPADIVYFFDFIRNGSTVGVYIHGYPPNLAVVFSATPRTVDGLFGTAPIFLSQGDVSIHVDGTIARTAYVKNTSLDPCMANLLELFDSA